MGPFGDSIAWNTQGLVGAKRFLEKVINIKTKTVFDKGFVDSPEIVKMLHQTIGKVSADITDFKFNTAISSLMIFANEAEKQEKVSAQTVSIFIKLLAPFAPHLSEEIFQDLKTKKSGKYVSIFREVWPEVDERILVDDQIDLIVQINGKLREIIKVDANISKDQALELVMKRETIQKWIGESKPKKIIFVPKKLINIVL
jgi:leucyl-tRNA synthetase